MRDNQQNPLMCQDGKKQKRSCTTTKMQSEGIGNERYNWTSFCVNLLHFQTAEIYDIHLATYWKALNFRTYCTLLSFVLSSVK